MTDFDTVQLLPADQPLSFIHSPPHLLSMNPEEPQWIHPSHPNSIFILPSSFLRQRIQTNPTTWHGRVTSSSNYHDIEEKVRKANKRVGIGRTLKLNNPYFHPIPKSLPTNTKNLQSQHLNHKSSNWLIADKVTYTKYNNRPSIHLYLY